MGTHKITDKWDLVLERNFKDIFNNLLKVVKINLNYKLFIMNYLKLSIGILIALSASRFIPHPPNFTSLIALSFYVPAMFGIRYIPVVLIAFIFTDIIIGFHQTLLFTWGSIFLIGYLSCLFIFRGNFLLRIFGSLSGAFIFFLLTNFGVWLLGGYGYTINGFLTCYFLALPFFTNTIAATLFFSILIEAIYTVYSLGRKFDIVKKN